MIVERFEIVAIYKPEVTIVYTPTFVKTESKHHLTLLLYAILLTK